MPPVHTVRPLDTSRIVELSMVDGGREMRITGAPRQVGAWVLTNRTITADGREFDGPADRTLCGRDTPPRECMAWVDSLHLRQSLTYQPASRFWAFQWSESGIFLALAALLAWLCHRRLRPR
jgi:hypothetical protein